MDIQQLLNQNSGAFVELPAGEYKGNFVINHPCRVIGNHTTLWAEQGTVLTICSNIVTIENLRVETLKEQDIAIHTNYDDTTFQNVEISGILMEKTKKEIWNLPKILYLGEIPCDTVCTMYFDIQVPCFCRIVSLLNGIEITPETLPAGRHRMTLHIEKLQKNTCLYGDILFETDSFIRRIYITGVAKDKITCYTDGKVVYSEKENKITNQNKTKYVTQPAVTWDKNALVLKKGQRIALGESEKQQISIFIEMQGYDSAIDIDPYVFLLQSDNQAKQEKDMIFFGNEYTENYSVLVEDKKVILQLQKVNSDRQRISIAYGIYESQYCFGEIEKIVVKLKIQQKDFMVFPLYDLQKETTVIAIDFYRYKGIWKVSAIGAGYIDGLKKLCESYGLEVEE